MRRPVRKDRRRFVQGVAGTLLSMAATSRLGWASWLDVPVLPPRFVYVGTEHAIRLYSLAANGRLTERQTIACTRPVAMTIANEHLYVANGIFEFENLPRGSVEAYTIDPASGNLKLKNRVPLSLSATSPRDLAVAPNGRSLVVATHGGGAYNMVTLLEDGRLGRVSGILKETGSGPHASQSSAHPAAVIFHRMGRVLTADQGSDKVSVLSLGAGELTAISRWETGAGSGPSSVVLHPDGKRLYVAQALHGSVSSFGYDPTAGRIFDHQQTVWTSGGSATASLAMHPSGELLFSTHGDGMQAWKITSDGSLKAWSRVNSVQPTKLHITADGRSVLALSNDALLRMEIDFSTPELAAPVELASLSKPLSVVTL